MDYAKVYEDWNKLPQCSISIPGERLWGRELPDGTYGLDNVPLTGGYMLHDIVNSNSLPEEPGEKTIVHRRWHHQLGLGWVEPEEEEEARPLREKMYNVLEQFGQPGFMFRGYAYVLLEDENAPETDVADRIVKALEEAGIEFPEKGTEQNEEV